MLGVLLIKLLRHGKVMKGKRRARLQHTLDLPVNSGRVRRITQRLDRIRRIKRLVGKR